MTERRLEYVPLDHIVPALRNPKAHSIGGITESVGRAGFVEPLIVDGRTGRLVGGHGRTETLTAMRDSGAAPPAGIELGEDGAWLVPVVLGYHSEDDADAEALLVALNQLPAAGGWDQPGLAELLNDLAATDAGLIGTGFDGESLAALLESLRPAEPEPTITGDPDAVPEPPAVPITQHGDLWELGPHRLVCGDSTDSAVLARALDGEQATLVFTSFPYAVGVDYGDTYEDDLASLRALLAAMPELLVGAVVPGGYVVTNFGDVVTGRAAAGVEDVCEFPMAVEYWPAFRAAGFRLHTRRIWAKPHARVAAPWCASSNRAATDWEHLWTWRAPGDMRLNERRDLSYLGVWDTSRLEGVEVGKAIHPAAFPVGIAALVLKVHSNRGERVLDPFAGTGSTLMACHAESRLCSSVELSPTYCDVIAHRWHQATGIEPLRNGEPVTHWAADA